MNIGDSVVTVESIGVVVGVSINGMPIVEWPYDNDSEFDSYAPEDLVVVEMPKPNEELDPTKDAE